LTGCRWLCCCWFLHCLFFPGRGFAWIFLVIPLMWVIRKMLNKPFVERTLLDIPILIILVQVLLSTLFAADPSHSFPKVSGLLLAIGLFYAIAALLKTEKLLKMGIVLFLGGGFLFSLLGLAGMYTFKVKHLTLLMKIKEILPQIDFNLPGAEMGFSPNAVGGILILIVPLFITLLYPYLPERIKFLKPGNIPLIKGKRFPSFLVVGLVVTAGVLLLTQSRGSWVGLVLAFGILFFISLCKKKTVLITVIIVLLVFAFILVPSLLKVDQVRLTTKQAEGTLLFRVQVWDQALPRIYEHPFLGIGLNEFRYLPEIKYSVSHAHNKFFHVAVELGIPALIAYLALLFLTGYMIVKTWQYKNTGSQWMKMVIPGLGCGLLAHTIYELTDVIPFGAKVGFFPWISLALIAAVYNYIIRVPKVS